MLEGEYNIFLDDRDVPCPAGSFIYIPRRMPLNDSWIAATAVANRIPVVSQDEDYDQAPGLEVIRV